MSVKMYAMMHGGRCPPTGLQGFDAFLPKEYSYGVGCKLNNTCACPSKERSKDGREYECVSAESNNELVIPLGFCAPKEVAKSMPTKVAHTVIGVPFVMC